MRKIGDSLSIMVHAVQQLLDTISGDVEDRSKESNRRVSSKISKLRKEGKDQDQAIAIALSMERRRKKKRKKKKK